MAWLDGPCFYFIIVPELLSLIEDPNDIISSLPDCRWPGRFFRLNAEDSERLPLLRQAREVHRALLKRSC
jgi:hypothetical protein